MRSAKHQPWGPSQTPVPTLGPAGGEGAGLRCVAGDLGVAGALAAPQAALPPLPSGLRRLGGRAVGRGAQPPRRYHPHQTPARRPPARVGAEARGRGWNSSQAGPPPGRPLPLAPRAPPSRPPANCVPPGPARSHMPPQGMPGLAGGGRALGRAGLGRERPAGKVGERERASPRPPRPPAPPLLPAGAQCRPDLGISHFPSRTRSRDDPRASGAGGPRGGGGGLGRGFSARPGPPPPPSARPQSPPARRRGQAVTFPHTPPAAGGFGAPVGSRGLISRGAGVWPAGPRVVSHTRCSPSPGAERAPSPS